MATYTCSSESLHCCLQALLANKPTPVQENGKVKPDEDETSSQDAPPPMEFFDIKTHRPLRLRKKLWEFYTAPITKFWGHSVSNI